LLSSSQIWRWICFLFSNVYFLMTLFLVLIVLFFLDNVD
jgi:hypothetical protein